MMNQERCARSNKRQALAVTALVLGILVGAFSVTVSADTVTFPDPALEASIREAIGKSSGDIHDSDLVKLVFLDVSRPGAPIASLEGIQHCINLTTLKLLDVNPIVDLNPLSGLLNLTQLILPISPMIADRKILFVDAIDKYFRVQRIDIEILCAPFGVNQRSTDYFVFVNPGDRSV